MQPKVYSADEHRILPSNIDKHAYYIIRKLNEAGFKAYLVGGGVRDLLLNRRPKDFDISTDAKPEEIKVIFRNCILIGRRFRLAHVRFGKKILEVSTFRAGDSETCELIIQDNIWGSPEEDVLRRDFTINGLFYDPEEEILIDYVGGFSDIEKKMLRSIGVAEIRFKQDPVRMIRLLKFLARFDLSADAEALDALNKCKEEITKSSPARILEELLRMLESGASEAFFRNLTEHGILHHLMPFMAKELENEKSSIYHFLAEADNELSKRSRHSIERPVLLCCLLFPILHEKVCLQTEKEKKPPHLGMIAEKSAMLIDQTFKPFFLLPRRMKAAMISIMTNQYRLTPLDERKRKKREPRDMFFALALRLFKIRTSIEPDYLKVYTDWTENIFKAHQPCQRIRKPKRQRRRKKRPNT